MAKDDTRAFWARDPEAIVADVREAFANEDGNGTLSGIPLPEEAHEHVAQIAAYRRAARAHADALVAKAIAGDKAVLKAIMPEEG